ncbi:hypothetical protein [Varibaculum massiliense]|uniref:hypothetical protein n=1 Tax=Varibaculum massiliense TaxID=1852372 RepID=UPI00288AADF0|nr:hypothetical protein [Varibaculum massiliense]
MDDADAAAGVATAIGIGIIVSMLIALALEILFIWLVYRDTKKYSDAAWERSGQSKVLWLVLAFFLGVIGLAIYFLAIAPKVREADIAIKSGQASGYGQVGLNGQYGQNGQFPQGTPPVQVPPSGDLGQANQGEQFPPSQPQD